MPKTQDSPPVPPDWIWPHEVADMYGVSTDTVARWAGDGLIPSYKLPSGRRRFKRAEIQELIEAGS